MKWLARVFLIVLALLSATLLWSSNNFDRGSNSPHANYSMFQYTSHDLEMTFAHADHSKQQCVACHHNYQDDSGQGLCLDCHKRDPAIAYKMRDQFHDLCMGCHRDKRYEGEESGPLRSCQACHTEDLRP